MPRGSSRSYLALTHPLDDAARRRILNRALGRLADASPELREELTEILRELSVPGFRNATRAPVSLQVAALEPVFGAVGAVFRAVAAVWLEGESALVKTARHFLVARGFSALAARDLPPRLLGTWEEGELDRLSKEFVAEDPTFEPMDAALALCMIASRAPTAVSDAEVNEDAVFGPHVPAGSAGGRDEGVSTSAEAGQGSSALEVVATLKDVVARLAALDPDDEAWSVLEGLSVGFRQALEAAAQRRNARRELEGALLGLASERTADLHFFGLSIDGWSASAVAGEDAPTALAGIAKLSDLLLRHAECRGCAANSVAELKRQHAELSRLEDEVFATYGQLAALFGPASPPPVIPTEVGKEPKQSEPEVTPSIGAPAAERLGGPEGPEGPTSPEAAPGTLPGVGDGGRVGAPDTGEADADPRFAEAPQGPSVSGDSLIGGTLQQPPAPPSELESGPRRKPGSDEPEGAEDLSRWHRAEWQLLAAGDVAGAYWLARACEEAGEPVPVPSWLTAALQGSFWLQGDTDPIVQDLLDISAGYVPGGPPLGVLGLAAALKPTLVAPASGMIAWLAPSPYPALHHVVEAIRSFAARGRALMPEDVETLKPVDALEGDVVQLRSEAREWLDKAQHFKSKATKGSDAWGRLVRSDIRDLLRPVVDDQRDRRDAVLRVLPEWQRRDPVVARIQKAYRDVTKRRNSELVGEAREQLVRWSGEAADIAARWCRAVERLSVASQQADWYAEQLVFLREAVRRGLFEASRTLTTLRQSGDVIERSQGTALATALSQVATLLQLEPAPGQAVRSQLGRGAARQRHTLEQALARRLLYAPGVQLMDTGEPAAGGMAFAADALCAAPLAELNPVAALRGWMGLKDFRFTEELLDEIPEQGVRAELVRDLRSQEAAAVSELRAKVDEANELLEQGVVDGIIGDAERSTYAGRLEAQLIASTRDVGRRLSVVASIKSELLDAASQRLAVQRERWRELEPELSVSYLPEATKHEICRRIEGAFQTRDTRLLDEFLAQLPEVIAGVIQPPPAWFERKPDRDSLERFTGMLPAIDEAVKLGWRIIIDEISKGRWPHPLRFPHPPKANVKEVLSAFEAWRTLKSSALRRVDAQRELVTLLAFLGFKPTSGSSSVTIVKESGDWVHVSAKLSDRELSLVPQFGSMAQGTYEVVCVWERPGVDTIGTWLREARLDTHPTVLLYLGRLPQPQRRSISRMARRAGWPVLALDESLLIFLAGERDARLPVFMACALPFAWVNPFTPFQAGDVPPEMFFGRGDMIRDLLAPQGSCIVYGGRQLGKSALLRAVQRKFSNPLKGHVACVVDIKLVGDPQAGLPPSALWPKVRDTLKEAGVLGRNISTENPTELQRHIREWLKANAGRRLILMLDEADNLLDADAKANFQVVTALRELMASTSRRFKVVFAGLHNVQRFQGIPNQPLAHFGTIEVGPLEPDAAYQLVQRPFHDLGYRFTPGTILRVLSYTNYHPGLIQLFCHFLLRRLQERVDSDPPYRVDQADVEAVYRDRVVQDGIRDRLDWTLDLDKRYQAIAWSLVVDQMQTREGYARTYSAPEILSLVSREWPAGFAAIGSDQIRGWLDEMCGLGVLVRGVDRRYRLRSPNLVRLMGREDDILRRLVELGDTQPPAVFEADSHHPVLSERAPRRYSPFTHAQERQLSEPRSGVCLVFASEALGLDVVTEAFRRFLPAERRSSFLELSGDRVEPASLPDAVRAALVSEAGRGGVVACYRPRSATEDLVIAVEQAVSWCREHGSGRRQWSRLLILLDAEATLAWAFIPSERRESLESAVDVALAPRRWDSIAIRQRLEHEQKIHNETVVSKLSLATGGWPFLLDTLGTMADVDNDLRPEAEKLQGLLADRRSDLARAFRRALGPGDSPDALAVLRCIRDLQDGELHDEMVADLVEATPKIESANCLGLIDALLRLGCVERRKGGSLAVEPLAAAALLDAGDP